jgi:HlyD family secretion protein
MWLSAILLAAVAVAAGYYLNRANQAKKGGGTGGGGAAIRMAPLVVGDLEQTIRLSGVVQAERFAALMAPQLRGSRTGRGSTGNVSYSASTPMSTAGGISASSGGSSSSSSSSSSSASIGSLGSSSASGGSQSSSDGTQRSAEGGRSSDAGRSSGGGGGSTRGGGSTGGGSTGGGGRGGGGGAVAIVSGGGSSRMGGGGSEFSLVLLSCAPGGSYVKKGDVVAEFDRQSMLLRLDDYRASVATIEANIGKLKAELYAAKEAHNQLVRVARADLEQTLLDLKTIEVRSAIQSERFQLAEQQARARLKQVMEEARLFDASQAAQLRAAELDYNQAKIELSRSEANAERMVLRAPIDGLVVMQTTVRSGEFGQIREGDQVASGMIFMTIVDPSSMVVNASVNQADSESLRLGMKARVRLDAYSEIELPATVVGVGAMTRPGGWRANWVREIPVRLKLDGMDPRVIPDLSASADVLLASERQAVIAPREAIFQEAGGNPFVFLRGPAGWTRREIEVGLTNNVAVAVRSGLKKGEVVAAEKPLS